MLLGRRAMIRSLFFLGFVASLAGCASQKVCTAIGIVRDMKYEAVVPPSVDLATTTIEICFGQTCDTSRLVESNGRTICEDIDTFTPNFPTTCELEASDRRLRFTTNTAYGGHAGSDRLVVTAIAASGARTELLSGTVTYTDTTDDAARGACTEAYEGTFTSD